jgi:hypothetical protein
MKGHRQLRKKMSPMPLMIASPATARRKIAHGPLRPALITILVKPVDPEALLRLLAEEAEGLSST